MVSKTVVASGIYVSFIYGPPQELSYFERVAGEPPVAGMPAMWCHVGRNYDYVQIMHGAVLLYARQEIYLDEPTAASSGKRRSGQAGGHVCRGRCHR